MPRFSANLSFLFNEVPFLERFAEAAHAGFRAVEFAFRTTTRPRRSRRASQEQKLEVVLFNAPPGDWEAGDRGLASLPGREHEFAASVSTALRYAQALKCRGLHVMAGVLPPDAERGGARAAPAHLRRATCRHACEEAAAQNVTILIEPINPRDMPDYLLNTQADAHAIREEVGMRQPARADGPLSRADRRGRPHRPRSGAGCRTSGTIQIAGVPDRHEPDQPARSTTRGCSGCWTS